MKAFLQSLIFLPIISLVGCGTGGKTNATLEVSRGFVISTSSFGGGLIISGKNLTTGKNFTQGLSGSRELNLVLTKGKWVFSAIGWEGGANNVPFTGMPYCGKVEQEFIRDSEVVDLSVTKENCSDPYFSAGHTTTESGITTFKKISIVNTCHSFFASAVTATSTVASSLVKSTTTAPNFCSSLQELDLQSKVLSFRISSINNLGLTAAGFQLSRCYEASAGMNNADEIRLPLNEFPFRIDIFESAGCVDQIASFPFPKGIAPGDPLSFDHLLVSNSGGGMRLVLPASDVGRAVSPFQHLLPSITKENSTLFPTVPTTLGIYHMRAIVGENKVVLEDDNCPATTITTTDGVQGATCTDLGEKIEIKFTGNNSFTSGTLVINGFTYKVKVEKDAELQRFSTQRKVIELIGTDKGSEFSRFYDIYREDDEQYGVLSMVRKMFKGDGPGGVIGIQNLNTTFTQACMDAVTDKTITFFNYEKMVQESYRVIVNNNSIGAPEPFICDADNAQNPACPMVGASPKIFDKKMILYDHKVSTINPIHVLKFNCSEFVGKMETNDVKIQNGIKEERRKILHWNTKILNSYLKRFEEINWIKRYNLVNGAYSKTSDSREITRFLTATGSNFEIWNVLYNSRKDQATGNYFEDLVKTRMKTTTVSSVLRLHYNIGLIQNTGAFESVFSLSGNQTFLDSLPQSLTQAQSNYYDFIETYPQTIYPTIGEPFDAFTTFFDTPTLKINGETNIQMTPASLNSASFKTTFGGNFYTNP